MMAAENPVRCAHFKSNKEQIMPLATRFTSLYQRTMVRLLTLFAALMAAPQAFALNRVDLTQDTSGGKKFEDIANNIDQAGQAGAGMVIGLVALGGYVVVALSLWQLRKASQDEREKPGAAILGLFIGGAMAGVGTIMWMMKNTVTG